VNAEPLPVSRETSGPFAGVCTVTLEQPGKPVVVLDLALIQRLEAALKSVPADATGVVVASASERVFVAGADLKSIQDLDDDQLGRYLAYGSKVFGMLARFACPTAAAINGAALGGGLELAMHCDGLIGTVPADRDGQPGRPFAVGLPEAGLGICPGWGGTNLLPARIDVGDAIARTASGETLTSDRAAAMGMFDAVAPSPGALLETAKRWVVEQGGVRRDRDGAPLRWVGRPKVAASAVRVVDALRPGMEGNEAGLAVLNAVDAGLGRGWEGALEVERRELIRLRHTPRAKEAIAAFFAKGKKGA